MHHPQRLVTKLGVAATAAVLLGLTGLPLWSLFFLVTVGTVFAVTGVGRAANPTRSPSDTA